MLKQKQKWCRTCRRKTLHASSVNLKSPDTGCAGHVFMTIVTLGLWIPIAILVSAGRSFSNALAPLNARYHCQSCGRKN